MRKFSFVILPILFLVYLIVETILKLNHSSLCHSKGCELAGALLNIPAIWLNYLGIGAALILVVLGYLSYIKAISRKYFYIVLSSMILFESIMLGYQFFASPELCKFCMGVYGFLWAIAILTMQEKILYLLPGVFSVLFALFLLSIPKSMVFVSKNQNYLIQSPTCPHCKKVKEYLKQNHIEFTKLDAKSIEARNFVKYLGYKTIPVLVVKEGSRVLVINGDENIIKYFEEKKIKVETKKPANKSIGLDNLDNSGGGMDLLNSVGQDDGCGIEIFQESSCEKGK